MKTENIALNRVRVNSHNPRTITAKKLDLLVASILTFPKMLEVRPIIVDKTYTALGGNMRLQALTRISKMSLDEIGNILGQRKEYMSKGEGERKAQLEYWQKWLDNPTATVVKADSFTEAEKKQFMIADNASFGQWDFDALANDWDNQDLVNWGVDVWLPEDNKSIESLFDQPTTTAKEEHRKEGLEDEEDPALQAVNHEKIESVSIPTENDTDDRIIITFKKEQSVALAAMLGVGELDKVVYSFDELNG